MSPILQMYSKIARRITRRRLRLVHRARTVQTLQSWLPFLSRVVPAHHAFEGVAWEGETELG